MKKKKEIGQAVVVTTLTVMEREALLDEALMESFPASDVPAVPTDTTDEKSAQTQARAIRR